VAPGEIVTLFGSNLGPATPVGVQLTSGDKVATQLAGTQVFFDGIAAPLLSVRDDQVTAIVPNTVVGRQTTRLIVDNEGARSSELAIPVASAAPGLFTADGSGRGRAAALNQNGSVNSPSNSAERGSIIVLYATGLGQSNPAGLEGVLAGPTPPRPVLAPSVTIDGRAADVSYAGGSPGLVNALVQVNVRVPANTRLGAVPVVLRVGDRNSQPDVTINVR
jgi:uncharacterized protein (TIGR03437 family)